MFLVLIPQVSNLNVDKIKERSARVTWNMDDVGEEYAKVTYYMVLYGTDDQTLDEQVLGMLF